MVKIHAVGGYSEVGKNMTCVEIGDDAFIFDCGIYLTPIVERENNDRIMTEENLRSIDAVPDDSVIKALRHKVRAILISHAHLDHVGAVPYIAHNYNAPIMGTPFTIEVLFSLINDNQGVKFRNEVVRAMPNSIISIKGKKEFRVEFVNITHSTIQASLVVLHTEKGAIIYANDFKFDNSPILGKKPNYERLKEIAKEGVYALIVDSLYSDLERKTPSEKIARGLLEDVLLTTANENAAIVVTTFSSHIARLKSIVDCGKQLDREILFLGRSLQKYVSAANKVKMVPFMDDINIVTFRNQLDRALKKVSKDRSKYLVVCTGHQGEPGAILDRLARDVLPFKFQAKDHVVFSSSVIPSPVNIANRQMLEKKLREKGTRIFTDVHVSGHCAREDLRDLIEMLQPQHIIPAHGEMPKLVSLVELATELGYKLGKDVHLLQDGQQLNLI